MEVIKATFMKGDVGLGEYTDKDMVKSLIRTIELLAEENKKLRQEIEGLRAIPLMRFDSASLGLPPVTDGKCVWK